MALDRHTPERTRELLRELQAHRNKLIGNLLCNPGNLEEEMYDAIIARLGAVQGCIAAVRDFLGTPLARPVFKK